MANHGSTPKRAIAESGDEFFGWDGSAEQEAFFPAGTAASRNVGPNLANVPSVDDLARGVQVKNFGAVRRVVNVGPEPYTGGDRYLRLFPNDGAPHLFRGVLRDIYTTNGFQYNSDARVSVAKSSVVGEVAGRVEGTARVAPSGELEVVTFEYDGQSWVGLRSKGGNLLSNTGFVWIGFSGYVEQGYDLAWFRSVPDADVSNPVVVTEDRIAGWYGFPGAAIGNFSPLRNTAIADMTVPTDFQVLEKQTWTPRLEGVSVAGSPTYVRQDGSLWRYGKLYYGTFNVEISAKDPAASGALLVRGAPMIADTAVVEHMATIHRFNNVAAPAGVIQYAPHYVPQGGLHAVRIHLITDNAAGSFLDVSALTDTTRIHGAFKFTVA